LIGKELEEQQSGVADRYQRPLRAGLMFVHYQLESSLHG
jgi:hypothetical protein